MQLFFQLKATLNESVSVQIYYEILNEESIRFITKVVAPVYEQLQYFMAIEFIPFGLATVSR